MNMTAAKEWDEGDDIAFVKLQATNTETLVADLRTVGAHCTELDQQLNAARHERTLLFLALEERDVPYRRMAAIAGNMSDVAVLRNLQRLWARRNPEPVA